MKFDITQQSAFSTLVTLFVMSVVGMFALIHVDFAIAEEIMSESLLSGFINTFQHSHHTLSAIISTLAIFWATVRLSHTMSNINLFGVSTTIHMSVVCVLLWCAVLESNFLLSTIITILGAYTIGLLLRSALSLNMTYLFNATLAMSLLPALYTPAIVLWIFVPFILLLMEVTLREAIASICGLLFPAAAVIYIYWLTGADFVATAEGWLEAFLRPTALFKIEIIPIFRSALIALSLLLSLLSLCWVGGTLPKTQMRFSLAVFVTIATLMSIFAPAATTLSVALLTPSLAILSSFTMANLRGRTANVLYFVYWILLLLAMFFPLDLPL